MEPLNTSLREHLGAHKAVPYQDYTFLQFIYFIPELHIQIINFV